MATLGNTLRQRSRPEPCVRFEAHESHACWQFDESISDAHYVAEQRALPEVGQSGYPHLALCSVVGDHSRVNDQEYHLVYGEEVEAALLFLFHAMAPKDDPWFPFQGIPTVLYMDNGPLAKSRVFHRVLAEKLGIEIKIHETPQPDGRPREGESGTLLSGRERELRDALSCSSARLGGGSEPMAVHPFPA
jgi:hypothetical protein